ncbi:hypothetical protein KKE06_01380 [Candidatus Micrarchaeota archaeon]|nr:hypothetical protein [Candidatus Micrarchaeota archaeon]MBU1930985.1 hypothetical protein [Candidatus Micrarchaeota archaeon]
MGNLETEQAKENTTSSVQKQAKSSDAIKKLAPDFHALSLDVQEVMQQSKDPAFVSALMFKLVQEREQTNKLLEQINEKYDKLMFELKTRMQSPSPQPNITSNSFEVLPEQDQMILNLVEEKGSVNSQSVKQSLGYKGLNAASQRLNKLYREGHLKKVQSGKQVLFVASRT